MASVNTLDEAITDWFPPEDKPVSERPGVYRTRYQLKLSGERFREGYSWWGGNSWGVQHATIEGAVADSGSSLLGGALQNKSWKGLSRDPYEAKA